MLDIAQAGGSRGRRPGHASSISPGLRVGQLQHCVSPRSSRCGKGYGQGMDVLDRGRGARPDDEDLPGRCRAPSVTIRTAVPPEQTTSVAVSAVWGRRCGSRPPGGSGAEAGRAGRSTAEARRRAGRRCGWPARRSATLLEPYYWTQLPIRSPSCASHRTAHAGFTRLRLAPPLAAMPVYLEYHRTGSTVAARSRWRPSVAGRAGPAWRRCGQLLRRQRPRPGAGPRRDAGPRQTPSPPTPASRFSTSAGRGPPWVVYMLRGSASARRHKREDASGSTKTAHRQRIKATMRRDRSSPSPRAGCSATVSTCGRPCSGAPGVEPFQGERALASFTGTAGRASRWPGAARLGIAAAVSGQRSSERPGRAEAEQIARIRSARSAVGLSTLPLYPSGPAMRCRS